MSIKPVACLAQVHMVKPEDLPLSCPTKNMRVWDAHPRVFLPIEETGEETCPYCGTKFVLKGNVQSK